jgi:thymidylate kinase
VTGQPPTIAIEGPCCAGKTTLAHSLVEESFALSIAYVRDYSDHVGGGRFLPPPVPTSPTEEELILNRFLEIESDRTAYVRMTAPEPGLIIIDRSVHTLLAHCFALRRLLNDDYFGLAQRVIGESDVPLWPDHILYLDVPQFVIDARNGSEFTPGSVFIDAGFNAGVRSYFQQVAGVPSPRVAWLDDGRCHHGPRTCRSSARAVAQTAGLQMRGGR